MKSGLRLSDLAFSAALAGLVAGAFVAQPMAGALATRFGSRRMTRVASVAACLTLALPALAPSLAALVAATALLGFTRGATEVPMNAQATLYELRVGAPRMSTFHACFSLGGFAGAGIAALLLRAGSPAAATLAGVGAGCAVVSALVSRHLLRDTPHPDAPDDHAHLSLGTLLRDGALVALGALAFCGMFGEGAMADWSALLLERTTGAAPAAAALGYAAFSVAMTLGRATGDAVIAAVGRARTLRASGVLAAAGLTLALVAPYAAAVAGCAIVGLGYANLVPILFSASGRRAGHAGIAAVSTVGYAGFVVGPPVIGGLSQLLGSLPIALVVVALFALAIAAGAGVVSRET
ncbi:major facilitator superfamily MFS_1 [Gemmatirosa kalamazoonensis]|uniref:Major facilitator superfamily MFS_1 n=1 Tax=Gemmatirosa kalamazoonensis TaxID=861299 RepID=W0RF16_9BACT|nr:major facilitator superfamily MFS_1 [Gemmatirosa kalamazoonensis]